MPTIIDTDNYTTQVSKYFQREIETGALPPLSKLKGVRELSRQFGVSQNIILAAMKDLESRRLVDRVARKGIFVSEMASNPDCLEVLMLIFMSNPDRDAFTQRMLSLVSSKAAAGKINFFTRIVTFDETKVYTRERQTRLLEAEVAKLAGTFHSDCAVVIGPRFRKEDVRQALKLPFPTLFLGNFHEGDYADLNYNRIGFADNYMDDYVAYIRRRGFRKAVVIESFEGPAAPAYAAARDAMLKRLEKLGVRTALLSVHDSRNPEEARRCQGLILAAQQAAAVDAEKTVYLFDCVINRPFFARQLQLAGIPLAAGDREILVTPLESMDILEPWAHYATVSQEEKESFNEYLCQQLQALAKGQLQHFVVDREIHLTII